MTFYYLICIGDIPARNLASSTTHTHSYEQVLTLSMVEFYLEKPVIFYIHGTFKITRLLLRLSNQEGLNGQDI